MFRTCGVWPTEGVVVPSSTERLSVCVSVFVNVLRKCEDPIECFTFIHEAAAPHDRDENSPTIVSASRRCLRPSSSTAIKD